jgi:hypothetical protein
MPDDPRVQQLLDELLGSHATPEQVCGSCPELLPVVRDRRLQVCRLRADLDALLPPTGDPTPRPPEAPVSDTHLNFLRPPVLEAFLESIPETEADAFLIGGTSARPRTSPVTSHPRQRGGSDTAELPSSDWQGVVREAGGAAGAGSHLTKKKPAAEATGSR